MSRAIKWGLVTVPYTAMWTAEDERREPAIVRELWSGQWLNMITEGISAFEGKPKFAMLHSDRCREVLRDELCQMCVRKLPSTVYAVNQGRLDEDTGTPHLTDGLPMCLDCMLEALNACPGMQRQIVEGKLKMFSVPFGAWRHKPSYLGIVPVEQGGNARINELVASSKQRVYGHMGLTLTSFKRIVPFRMKSGGYVLRRA